MSTLPQERPHPFASVPLELVDAMQWVCWRYELDAKGRKTKVPHDAFLLRQHASTTDAGTWHNFWVALTQLDARLCDGIGYVFAPRRGVLGIDLDHCRSPQTGEIAQWALEIVQRFNTYTEISPSGEGLHLFVRGDLEVGRHQGAMGGCAQRNQKLAPSAAVGVTV